MNIGFKVSVRCMTYNQAAYIEDAMDGFCMQQTDFPFVCIIMDDASTDGEQKVIQKYLESHFDLDDLNLSRIEENDDYKLIFARHKENRNCYFAVFYLKYNHYGSIEFKNRKLSYYSKLEAKTDYIALCEGDDYWIDSLKLQKQMDFLESYPEYGMCYTKFDILLSKENVMLYDVYDTIPQRYKIVNDLETWIETTPYAAPMSWVARRDLWSNIPPITSSDGTFLFFANFLDKTSVHCLEGPSTAVYRIVQESASHTTSIVKEYKREKMLFYSQISLADYYKQKISNSEDLKKRIKKKYYNSKFMLIILNKDHDEIKKALDSMGNCLSIKNKLLLSVSKINFFVFIMCFLWEHKIKFRNLLRIDTGLLHDYKINIFANKKRYASFYNELTNKMSV